MNTDEAMAAADCEDAFAGLEKEIVMTEYRKDAEEHPEEQSGGNRPPTREETPPKAQRRRRRSPPTEPDFDPDDTPPLPWKTLYE